MVYDYVNHEIHTEGNTIAAIHGGSHYGNESEGKNGPKSSGWVSIGPPVS